MNYWSRPDILERFRWRLMLYKAGWVWFWLAFAVAPVVAWFAGIQTGFPIWVGMVLLSAVPMLPASTCIHCGANKRHASLSNGFDCRVCGAVHHDPDGLYLGKSPQTTPLPDGLEKCWLYPPLLVKYAKRQRISRIGMWTFLSGIALGGLWMAAMKWGWNPLPVGVNVYFLLGCCCLVSGLALGFIDSRCPHCRAALNSVNRSGASRLAKWCGWCGAVLVLKPEVRRAFMGRGRVVNSPPDLMQPETVDELIDEADRLMKAGKSTEAYDVIQRALHRYQGSGKLSDWLLRQ
ncbi:MAG: hypothetical protein JNN20_09860 [Betaproteobacteria bacterium]|nr:hypothetical protein [Betaproteobacteria bacterium]